MGRTYNTIHDMMEAYYGSGGRLVQKDAPVLTTTTGVYNAVFGAMAFSQLNSEANIFAAMPKYPWPHSGFRAITAHAGSTGAGTVSEAGEVPATIKPTFAEVTIRVAEVAHSFDVSFRHEGLVKTGDDAFGNMEQLRPYFASLHALRINEQMCFDYNSDGSGEGSGQFESLDRITMTTAGRTNLSGTDGQEDIYQINRSASSWADAGLCDENAGTDRYLTMAMIEDGLATLQGNGARTNLIVTGSDTFWRIVALANSQVRYNGAVKQDVDTTIGINGVGTATGMNFGVKVATIYGIPVIVSQSVQQDTISRLYLLDTTMQEGTGTPRLGVAMLHPTMYFESGMSAANPNPFAINKFATEGVFYTAGQLVCTFFKAQGQIRDLK